MPMKNRAILTALLLFLALFYTYSEQANRETFYMSRFSAEENHDGGYQWILYTDTSDQTGDGAALRCQLSQLGTMTCLEITVKNFKPVKQKPPSGLPPELRLDQPTATEPD